MIDLFFRIGVFPVILTLAAFRMGQLCQEKWKSPLLNPILIGVVLVSGVLIATKTDMAVYNSGIASISWLMTPATVALAIPMYEQYRALKANMKAILAGVAAGAVSCLVLVTVCGLLLKLDRTVLISLMPKSVTSAIGAPLSELFGGMGAVTTAAIIFSGIFANMLGVSFCKLFKITDPVAQGVAFGTAGHVIATTKANEISPLIGAVSSLSLVVAGLLTAAILPVMVNFL